jgi:hypothetical protein
MIFPKPLFSIFLGISRCPVWLPEGTLFMLADFSVDDRHRSPRLSTPLFQDSIQQLIIISNLSGHNEMSFRYSHIFTTSPRTKNTKPSFLPFWLRVDEIAACFTCFESLGGSVRVLALLVYTMITLQ